MAALTARYCRLGLATGTDAGTSEANAWQTLASCVAGYAAGQQVNITSESGYYQEGAPAAFATSAGTTTPVYFCGYTTTPGDGGLCQIDMQANALTVTGDNLIFDGFDITGDVNATVLASTGQGSGFYRTKCVNANTGASATAVSVTEGYLIGCYAEGSLTGANGIVECDEAVISRCFVKSNTENARGIYAVTPNVPTAITGCVIVGAGEASGRGLHFASIGATHHLHVAGNTFYNWQYGINLESAIGIGVGFTMIENNVIYKCAVALNNVDTEDVTTVVFNNATGDISGTVWDLGNQPILDAITLTANPFVDAASDDFRLNTAEGGGALCRGAGLGADFQTSFPFTGDVGALPGRRKIQRILT